MASRQENHHGDGPLHNFSNGNAGRGVYCFTDIATGNNNDVAGPLPCFTPSWCLSPKMESFHASEYNLKPAQVPEIAFDPDESSLSLINALEVGRFFYVSVYHKCLGRNDVLLTDACTTPPKEHPDWPTRCVTFAVAMPPRSIVALCQIADVSDDVEFDDLRISSDVQTFTNTTQDDADADARAVVRFPLQATQGETFLCTQGFGGALTHCMSPCTFHAVDFAAEVGTPCVAVGDGVVTEVCDSTPAARASGVGVHTLFEWNAVSIELDNTADETAGVPPLVCEYVHIDAGSARVKVGQRVRAGDVVCATGSVGFTPEPHLHFQVARGSTKTAQTVPFRFMAEGGVAFVPVAGVAYTAAGPVL